MKYYWGVSTVGGGCLYHENLVPILFPTRAKARKWREEQFSYIKLRKALKVPPHGWKFPLIVKVKVSKL